MRALLAPTAHVVRDGRMRERPAAEVVPGDLVALGAGDRVPADGRVVDGTLLQVDESALTGESLATGKRAGPPDPAEAPLAERHTAAARGHDRHPRGRALRRHRHGRRAPRWAASPAPRRAAPARTPLQVRLDRLSRLLIPIAAGICGTLALLAYLQGDTLAHSVLVGVSLAVAALPEGLPGRRDDHAGAEHAPDGRARRDRSPAGRGGDARLDHRDLQRQDRHADREPPRRPAPVGRARVHRGRSAARRPSSHRERASRPTRSSWRSSPRPRSTGSAASALDRPASSRSARSTPSASA